MNSRVIEWWLTQNEFVTHNDYCCSAVVTIMCIISEDSCRCLLEIVKWMLHLSRNCDFFSSVCTITDISNRQHHPKVPGLNVWVWICYSVYQVGSCHRSCFIELATLRFHKAPKCFLAADVAGFVWPRAWKSTCKEFKLLSISSLKDSSCKVSLNAKILRKYLQLWVFSPYSLPDPGYWCNWWKSYVNGSHVN